MGGCITDVTGIKAGHAQDFEAVTGCTVLLFEEGTGGGTRGGIYYGGHASGSRACDLFREGHINDELHGLVLSGGSNYGLDAAGGVMGYLRDNGVGFPVGNAIVPIVPQAIIFDLGIGSPTRYPDYVMGYEAADNASDQSLDQGSVGAGTGATVGKVRGIDQAVKGGVGSASLDTPFGRVGAVAVVNAVGDIVDPETEQPLYEINAQPNSDNDPQRDPRDESDSERAERLFENTTICTIATEADLTKSELNWLAERADRAIQLTHRPAHHSYDGDVVFAISTRRRNLEGELEELGSVMEHVLIGAILSAIKNARTLAGVPSLRDLNNSID